MLKTPNRGELVVLTIKHRKAGTTNFSDLESENLNYNTSREYLYVGKAYLSIWCKQFVCSYK